MLFRFWMLIVGLVAATAPDQTAEKKRELTAEERRELQEVQKLKNDPEPFQHHLIN